MQNNILSELRRGAAECTVLLNRDGSFPIGKPCKVALYGNGARNTAKVGTGSGGVNCGEYNSIEKALIENGFEVTTAAWLDRYDKAQLEYVAELDIKGDNALQNIFAKLGVDNFGHDYDIPLGDKSGDICFYVLKRISGEGSDRNVESDVLLTKTEIKDILELNERYDKFMLVLNVAGVVDLSPVKNVKNILLLSQLGQGVGDVFADIILGKSYPSGKLASTWAAWEDYSKLGDFGDNDETLYKEGVYVGYRYFDTIGKQPLYPFGFGLSYTDFEISETQVKHSKSVVTVSAKVKNIGKTAGKEVVQAYISCPSGKLDKPYQNLAAFKKTKELAAGKEETAELSFDLKDLATYFEDGAKYVLEKGDYVLRVGNSSKNTKPVCIIRLKEDVVTARLENAFAKPTFKDEVISRAPSTETCANIISLSASDFECEVPDYKIDRHINPAVKKLSDYELIHFCIGAYTPKVKAETIGSASTHLAGAAGETSGYVYGATGGKYLVLSDGPAGLRISDKAVKIEGGEAVPMNPMYEIFLNFFPREAAEKMRENMKKLESFPQITRYCVAIPVAYAQAQSFNPEVCELFGEIMGADCEKYGADILLAPSMNIHRNILCGRNFEYYSEDPLVAGIMAGAVVKGIQKSGKTYATIKHFCANNQETNRFHSNSQVSERALREIYLKGFEICVKTAKPKAVMTSYNLVNGTHTSQTKELIDGILRGEWCYDGIVMTDWVSTEPENAGKFKHDGIYAHKVVKAGNDIIMPGSETDYEDIESALADGRISREDIEVCATRIYESILKLK